MGQEQVRPYHTWQLVFQRGRALELNQLTRFAQVEPAGDPFRLLAFNTFSIQQIDGAIKLQPYATEPFQIFGQIRFEVKRCRRDAPFVAGKQSVRGQAASDPTGAFGVGAHDRLLLPIARHSSESEGGSR
jgi:hypothetical protein